MCVCAFVYVNTLFVCWYIRLSAIQAISLSLSLAPSLSLGNAMLTLTDLSNITQSGPAYALKSVKCQLELLQGSVTDSHCVCVPFTAPDLRLDFRACGS